MDLEADVEKFGAADVEDLTWKNLLDGYSCTECGRCQDVCPAWATDKELSPKLLIMALRDQVFADGPKMLRGEEGFEPSPLVPNAVKDEIVWDCVTCGACVRECPVSIEHVDHIVDLRRHLVMMDSSFPSESEQMLRDVERASNPWGKPQPERAAWADGLDVRVLEPGDEPPDVLDGRPHLVPVWFHWELVAQVMLWGSERRRGRDQPPLAAGQGRLGPRLRAAAGGPGRWRSAAGAENATPPAAAPGFPSRAGGGGPLAARPAGQPGAGRDPQGVQRPPRPDHRRAKHEREVQHDSHHRCRDTSKRTRQVFVPAQHLDVRCAEKDEEEARQKRRVGSHQRAQHCAGCLVKTLRVVPPGHKTDEL